MQLIFQQRQNKSLDFCDDDHDVMFASEQMRAIIWCDADGDGDILGNTSYNTNISNGIITNTS